MAVVIALEVVENATFIRLKVPTRSTKIANKTLNNDQMTRRLGLTLEIRVFNLVFENFHFSPNSSNLF